VAAARAGGAVRFPGAVGDDELGGEVLAALTAAGVDTTPVVRTSTPTGTAHITVDAAGEATMDLYDRIPDATVRLTYRVGTWIGWYRNAFQLFRLFRADF